MDITGTISLIEVIFICITAPGFVYSMRGTRWALIDLREQQQSKVNGARLLAARVRALMHIAVLASLTIFVLLSLLAAFTPSSSNASRSLLAQISIALYTVLVATSSLCLWQAERYYNRLVALLIERAKERARKMGGVAGQDAE